MEASDLQVTRWFDAEDLDGNRAVEVTIVAKIGHGHAAGSELGFDAEASGKVQRLHLSLES